MRSLVIVLSFVAALNLALPPTIHAEECYSHPYQTVGYFPDCDCTACSGWALTNCTECWDAQAGTWCQTTSTRQHCTPSKVPSY